MGGGQVVDGISYIWHHSNSDIPMEAERNDPRFPIPPTKVEDEIETS